LGIFVGRFAAWPAQPERPSPRLLVAIFVLSASGGGGLRAGVLAAGARALDLGQRAA
jgi:hypothetical protein